jgi:hypothetical protein
MATRGTVLFRSGENEGGKILGYIYIHHDMYPEGFASYLKEVFENEKVRGNNLMCKLIRTIERAEIIPCHEWHSDTDFRYTVIGGLEDDGYVSVSERDWNERYDELEYKLVKVMKLKDFIDNPSSVFLKE